MKVEVNDWTKTKWAWFLDKFVIAIIVIGVNYWTEIKKTEYTTKVKMTENISSKTQEIWEAVGKYRASLERINRLKREQNTKLTLNVSTKNMRIEIQKEIETSKQLEDSVQQKINLLRSEVGKPITEHVTMYVQLLTMYHQQLDSLMFDEWPPQFDRSQQFKHLEKVEEQLYQMEMSPHNLQQYIEQQFMY